MSYARSPPPENHTPLRAASLYEAKRINALRQWLRNILLRIAGWLQGHPVWPNPMAQFYALEDRRDRIYVWTMQPGATLDEANDFAQRLHEGYVARYNRVPKALHIVHHELDAVYHLTRSDVEEHILPHLREE